MKNNNFKIKLLKRFSLISLLFVIITICQITNVYCANDPLAVINNLSNFIFGLIRAVGLIILGYGIMQVGMSLKSHDPAQKATGMWTLAGGVVITFTKEILNLITGG